MQRLSRRGFSCRSTGFAASGLDTSTLGSAVIHRVDQRPVSLRDDVAPQLAGARQHAVIGAQLLVQDGKAVDLGLAPARAPTRARAFTVAMQSAISA